jgi:mannitol/fructose-specific phosphotransferase system IIA component (Ntr-type)
MLAPSPSQHLESEIRPHGNPPYDSDIPNPALVVLLLIPGNTHEHLKALAAISRRLRDRKIANDLRAAQASQEGYEALTRSP